MAGCIPHIDQPEIKDNDIIFRGRCEKGTCAEPGGCKARFSLTLDGKLNKGAKVTGSGYGGDQAFIRVTADSDIDNGVVVLECKCGEVVNREEYSFTLEHRTTAEDVFIRIITLGIRLLFPK